MDITDSMVLPSDVTIVPVAQLSEDDRKRLAAGENDLAITRPRGRSTSKLIDVHAADLLSEFRSPKRIVDAVIAYGRSRSLDPQEVLSEAFPIIKDCINARFLVPAGSPEANRIEATLYPSHRVGPFRVLRCVEVLEDSEVYQVKDDAGRYAALKIARPGYIAATSAKLEREAKALRHLAGVGGPQLLESGTFEERPYLALEWCSGISPLIAAGEIRDQTDSEQRRKLLALCGAVVAAYAALHEHGVIHGDVHPKNVLLGRDGAVTVLDFGLARLETSDDVVPRGGIAFFYEPEYASARLAKQKPVHATTAGEQFAVAALLYLLLTGDHYLEFSLGESEMLRQIVGDAPLPFTSRGTEAWPEVESVLAKALSKDPADRFRSMEEFAQALRGIQHDQPPRSMSLSRATATVDSAEMLRTRVVEQLRTEAALYTSGLSIAPIASVFYGAAGIAYALYRMACSETDSSLLFLADSWITRAVSDFADDGAFYNADIELTPDVVGRISPYHCASGAHCVRALIFQAMGDLEAQQDAVVAFVTASLPSCDKLDLTLGRAGTLLAGALLLESLPADSDGAAAQLHDFGNTTVAALWEVLSRYNPIPACSEFANLGMAHGWAGVLYATLRWCRASRTELPDALELRLAELAECGEPAGRGIQWPWITQGEGGVEVATYMSGWCNGSAGFVPLWTLAHRHFRRAEYLDLAEQAAWNAWEDPSETASLCCGLPGRSYALINLYKNTGEELWLERARTLATRASVSGSGDGSEGFDFSHSLYKGDVGVAVLATDLLRPETASMPFFEEEGWPLPPS